MRRPPRACAAAAATLVALVATSACAPRGDAGVVDTDPLSSLPKHEAQLEALCARARGEGRVDAVITAFCTDPPPQVTQLTDVHRLLDVALDSPEGLPGISLLGHATALPSRSVSAINPGSIIVSLPQSDRPLNGNPGRRRTDGNVVTVAFARGDNAVELGVTPPGGEPTFYLLKYERHCGEACTFEELLTVKNERDWLAWSLYDDTDLANTVFDCLHCHQPDGPGTQRIYRMQELENPWTHWIAPFTLSGRVLLDDMRRAHGDEVVAGIPGHLVVRTDPVVVEDLARFSDSPQPNEFFSPAIEREVMESNPAQPADNTIPGTSPTWDALYQASVEGRAIPPPYHDVKVTDPGKLADMTAALVAWRNGEVATLPDLRDVFHDAALAKMSHRVQPGLDGRGILVHACAQCHNPRLDQELSRARFDAMNVDGLDAEGRAEAVRRLRLPREDRFAMPPRLFRDLTPDEIERAVAFLEGRGE